MPNITNLKSKIFSLGEESFEDTAIEMFLYQYRNNKVYREYLNHLHIQSDKVDSVEKIPFLPIELFKKHILVTEDQSVQTIFESSGTTGMATSKHYVADIEIYEQSILNSFRMFYGEPCDFIFFALLPSYLERSQSSLVFMVNYLRKESNNDQGGFYLYDHQKLAHDIIKAKETGKKIFIIGVSFALLDFADSFPMDLSEAIIMETGGMKGRREELIREELHNTLKKAFNAAAIHSEYSMTELLSQAYAKDSGLFHTPPWMKILIREPNDPFTFCQQGQVGGINIIDLANIYSCAFIATQDLGKLNKTDGSFEVLGRFDNSDIRGCSLLY